MYEKNNINNLSPSSGNLHLGTESNNFHNYRIGFLDTRKNGFVCQG